MRHYSNRYVGPDCILKPTLSGTYSLQLVSFCNKFGGGFYNIASARELRWQRIQDSIATNPQFTLIAPRYLTAYADAVLPIAFFIDGRDSSGNLNVDVARGFYQDGRMPNGFFRANVSTGLTTLDIGSIFSAHPIEPGGNNGTVNSYTLDPDSADLSNLCKLYSDFVTKLVGGLYPNANGQLLTALNQNLDFFYVGAIQELGCAQVPRFV
jgi:hypothetical protein